MVVIQDSEPPFVYVDEPADGTTVLADKVTVIGRVSDMLSGFLGLTVTVNDQMARIAIGIGTNGTFERADVPLMLGANTIRIVAADVVGNTSEREVTVTREEIPESANRLEAVSGSGQDGPIHALLLDPIVVRVSGPGGEPLEGRFVTFEIVRSDGRLSARPFRNPEAHAHAGLLDRAAKRPLKESHGLARDSVTRVGADGAAPSWGSLPEIRDRPCPSNVPAGASPSTFHQHR